LVVAWVFFLKETAFHHTPPRFTVCLLGLRTGLTRANARRILLTLQTLGYVSQDGRHFSLRPRVLEIGYAYLSSLDLSYFAQPIIDDLVERTRVPCNLAMLDGDEIIYVLRSSTRHSPAPPIPVNVGRRFPAYITSMGRILLGGLPDDEFEAYLARANLQKFTDKTIIDRDRLREIVKEDAVRGFSFTAGEHADWVASIAVPVRDVQGEVLAALGMGWMRGSVPEQEMLDRLLPPLQGAARSIERSIAQKK
jgi:IclR family pca regulon transcriptional regulator